MDFTTVQTYLLGNKYIYSLTILVVFFIISKLVVYISEKWILKLAAKTKTKMDDLIVERTNRPISLLLFFLGLRLAIIPLNFGTILNFEIKVGVGKFIESFSLIILFYIFIKVFDIIIDEWGRTFAKKTKSKIDDDLLSLFHRFSRIFLIIIAFLLILTLWGVKIGPFLASLGIAGIAIAFALQSTLSNIFGGISLILDKSVKVGDIVKLDMDTRGTVIDVGLRSTKLRTFDNEVIIVPNGKLVDSQIENFGLPDPSARVVVEFGVEYGSDVDKVKKVIMAEIKKMKNIEKEPEPTVMFLMMADFSLNFSARFWVADYKDRFAKREEATCLFYKALNKNKIGIPFPTRTVYMKKS